MNVRMALFGAAIAAACQPPPEVVFDGTGDPGDATPDFSIVFPPSSNADGDGPFEFNATRPGEGWEVVVALDIENMVYVDPYSDPGPDLVDGQGHWHVDTDVAELGTLVGFAGAGVLEVPRESFTPGNTLTLTVTLRDNKHAVQLDANGDEIASTVEVKLVDE